MIRQLKIAVSVTKRESRSIEKYLQEIAKLPPLSPEQEVALTVRMKAGDEKAFKTLVDANLRFVVSVAKQYQNQGLALDDLINIGNEGLMIAIRRFDETKGFKLISYAVWWIRQRILEEIAESGRIVRLPLNKLGFQNRVWRIVESFEQEFERLPDAEEIATLLKVDVSHVEKCLLTMNRRHLSLDAPISDDGDDSFGDMMDSHSPSPDGELIKNDLHTVLMHAISKLSPIRQKVLMLFFGINQEYPWSLDSIALEVKLSRERARQIKERAIKQLQKGRYSHQLRPFLG
jgi:RNA polymerase primary sigma factor